MTCSRVYIGNAGLSAVDNQAVVYWDEALTITANQPLRTSGGYLMNNGSPGKVFIDATSYSITVQDKRASTVYSALTANTTPPIQSGFIDSESATSGQVLTADGSGGSNRKSSSSPPPSRERVFRCLRSRM